MYIHPCRKISNNYCTLEHLNIFKMIPTMRAIGTNTRQEQNNFISVV